MKRPDPCTRVIGMNAWLLRQQWRSGAYLQAALTIGRMLQLRVLRWLILGAVLVMVACVSVPR